LQETSPASQSEIEALLQEIHQLRRDLSQTKAWCDEKSRTIESFERKLEASSRLIDDLREEIRHGEATRRQLHNVILELKGNIRVFCRIRPIKHQEITPTKENDRGSPILHVDDHEINIVQDHESATGKSVSRSFTFSFDKIFGPDATQDQVFEEISQLVQSALDGYRICIFAWVLFEWLFDLWIESWMTILSYGQTGSGKTYTMEGPSGSILNGNIGESGIIPRAVQQIFESTKDLESKGWRYELEVSILEIYNEAIRDLLDDGNAGKKHEIKHNPKDHTTLITDLTTGKHSNLTGRLHFLIGSSG
jgi:kinesin family member C1